MHVSFPSSQSVVYFTVSGNKVHFVLSSLWLLWLLSLSDQMTVAVAVAVAVNQKPVK
jgi:hypothetical protein